MPTWIMQLQSVLIVALMIYGITRARINRKLHVKIMSISMIWDVILILQIELSRQAILKATEALKNPILLNIHVSIAVTTVVFYVFMVLTGRKVITGNNALVNRHKLLGRITMILRILTLITSFMAVAPKESL